MIIFINKKKNKNKISLKYYKIMHSFVKYVNCNQMIVIYTIQHMYNLIVLVNNNNLEYLDVNMYVINIVQHKHMKVQKYKDVQYVNQNIIL